ncbi:hypothetical protein BJV78DRAFT_1354245 [Lactifluus subvellereus]|nr:hypothetical protein BJV78DRAFT_1354245 [Lactifluus subvellereus]
MFGEDNAARKLHLIAWKDGWLGDSRKSCWWLQIRPNHDFLMLLNLPGIGLCHILDIKGTISSSGSVPHMKKPCTLLFPPLQNSTCMVWATCAGERPGHEAFYRGPLAMPEYPPASPSPS